MLYLSLIYLKKSVIDNILRLKKTFQRVKSFSTKKLVTHMNGDLLRVVRFTNPNDLGFIWFSKVFETLKLYFPVSVLTCAFQNGHKVNLFLNGLYPKFSSGFFWHLFKSPPWRILNPNLCSVEFYVNISKIIFRLGYRCIRPECPTGGPRGLHFQNGF